MKKALFAAILLTLTLSCTRVPPRRMLPEEIQRIYVPMFENKSYQPGIEEGLTRATQEEFWVDGRLDVVRPPYADVVLKGTIRRFDIREDRLSYDEIPISNRIDMIVDVAMYDPSDREREEPLMSWNDIDLDYTYVSDMRRIQEISPADAFEDAMELMARRIVDVVITSSPEEYAEMREAEQAQQPERPRSQLGTVEVDAPLQGSEPVRENDPLLPEGQSDEN